MTSAAEKSTAPGVIRRYFAALDYCQLGAMLLLLGTGLTFIYSTGIQIGGSDPCFFFRRQIMWIAGGAVLWVITSMLDCDALVFKAGVVLFYLLMLIALVVVLVAGVKVFGATRWLEFAGFRLQPSEFTKLAVVLMLALLFSLSGFSADSFVGISVSFLTVLVPFILIAAEPDFGSAFLLLPLFAAVIFSAGLKWQKVLIALIVITVAATALLVNEVWQFKPLLKSYQRERIMVFLDNNRDRLNHGYNVYQAKLAVGSGGKFGKGIGEGTQNRLGFLPQTVSNNDFIFSVIAEETGFFGVTALLALFGVLLYSLLRTAYLAGDPFGRLFAVGIATVFFSHLFINIGMCVGITPVTGLSLPFVSYGGSFVMTGMASLGIMQSIRRKQLNSQK